MLITSVVDENTLDSLTTIIKQKESFSKESIKDY
jgi:hypothetical protein